MEGRKEETRTESAVACDEHYSLLIYRFAQPVRADVPLCEGGEGRYVLDADYQGTPRSFTTTLTSPLLVGLGLGLGVADELVEDACEVT